MFSISRANPDDRLRTFRLGRALLDKFFRSLPGVFQQHPRCSQTFFEIGGSGLQSIRSSFRIVLHFKESDVTNVTSDTIKEKRKNFVNAMVWMVYNEFYAHQNLSFYVLYYTSLSQKNNFKQTKVFIIDPNKVDGEFLFDHCIMEGVYC
ncbi:hypothetical protein DERF_008228 [Dermatophagoides farinae]|uniref:Uncharacterized protein n=1 Tax=Dermatophagoides farinae TaxID=6954 RepID=A0A922HZV9_DERFA|nr:hypothetical protein DERF_008228 [Dermatophagoides farinae]